MPWCDCNVDIPAPQILSGFDANNQWISRHNRKLPILAPPQIISTNEMEASIDGQENAEFEPAQHFQPIQFGDNLAKYCD